MHIQLTESALTSDCLINEGRFRLSLKSSESTSLLKVYWSKWSSLKDITDPPPCRPLLRGVVLRVTSGGLEVFCGVRFTFCWETGGSEVITLPSGPNRSVAL